MKALNCKKKILLAFILLAGTGLYAQEVKKELHEEFSTTKSTVLSIDCKFCDLTIKNWEKNQAVFDVTIKAEHPDQAKAKKMLEEINVEFKKDGDIIRLTTKFDDDLSKIDLGNKKKFSIIIVANVPSYINLDLETKFGSATLGEFSGNTELNMSFGSVEIEGLSGSEISIHASQGDMSIGQITDAEIEMNFGTMRVQDAGNLSVELNQGDLKIGSVNSLSAEVKMGNCVIDLVRPSFTTVEIEVSMGNVELGIDKNAGFSVEAEMKMGSMDIPNEIGKVVKGKNGASTSFEGKYGNGKSLISLEGNMGKIELKLK